MIGLNRTRWGYLELAQKPTPVELATYYSQRYFQDGKTAYQKSYGDEELAYISEKIEQKHKLLCAESMVPTDKAVRMLEVGVGEGFAMSYFSGIGWDVTGLDYSDHAVRSLNPHCVERLGCGDINDSLMRLRDSGARFDVVWLDNVLEHALDPLALLQSLHRLAQPDAALVIEVPNDFSALQLAALDAGLVDRPHWVVVPDHISYFNRPGLQALCAEAGWATRRVIADFPIDFFLFNDASNYYRDPAVGKAAHRARVHLERLLHAVSPDKTNVLYEALADLGFGRQIIAFCSRAAA